jgi:hypothetical protein
VTIIDEHTVVALIPQHNLALDVKSATVTLAEDRAPYARAELRCSNPTPEDRELIDLRGDDLLIDVRLRRDFGRAWQLADLTERLAGNLADLTELIDGASLSAVTNSFFLPFSGSQIRASESRNMRLYITDRQFNDETGEATITAASGEALLLGDRLAASSSFNPSSTNLATIVQTVLNRYGAQLQPSPATATVAESAATIWKPGVSAWDYLEPLLETASLRLWCDEGGLWYLTERLPIVPGQVVASALVNLTRYVDRMTFDANVWTDAVVVEYRWVDEFDLNQVAYDYAGAQPARAALHLVRENTVYPGPGAAAGILNRAQGRGRVLEIATVSSYRHTPGQAAQITPLVGDVQTGSLSALTWKVPEGEAELRTRGLVDTPETAYIFGPSGFSYLDVPADISYLDFDWSIAS